jgi:hypothetical protein
MSFKLEIDLTQLKALQKAIVATNKLQGEVGFFPEDQYGPDNDNLPVAAVADMQQKGAGNYPKRPFFDDAVEDRRTRHLIGSQLTKALTSLVTGANPQAHLENACEALVVEVQTNIIDYPGSNSPDWAAFKGKDDPLSYTDTMLHAVKFKLNKQGGRE